MTDEAKHALKLLLKKDPAERIELTDFVDLAYCLMDESELDQKIGVAKEKSGHLLKLE